jgi:hypothetical protein
MLVHTDDKNFVCDECAAKFKRKDDLKVHMRIHLPDEVRAAEKARKLTKVCETCGKKFEKNWKLKRHMVVHTKDNNGGVAFGERATTTAAPRWHAAKTEAVAAAMMVMPEVEQKFIVLNEAKFVSADGKYVTTPEAKFVSVDGKSYVTTEAKFVSADGKFVSAADGKSYVTTEAKFVQDRLVFNQIQFTDV